VVRQNYIARFRAEAAMPKCSLQLDDWGERLLELFIVLTLSPLAELNGDRSAAAPLRFPELPDRAPNR
jgi:hypothetical protein